MHGAIYKARMPIAGHTPQQSLLRESSLGKKQTAQKCYDGFAPAHGLVGKVRHLGSFMGEKPLKNSFFRCTNATSLRFILKLHMIDPLRYPIGPFHMPEHLTPEMVQEAITTIAKFPTALQHTLALLPEGALDRCYRDGGWTGRQVVHHLADSHMNFLLRMKWALTEDQPHIRPYFEARWAELPDSTNFPVGSSLQILQGVHQKLAQLMANLGPEDLKRSYFHPEKNRHIALQEAILSYAWHCKHHMGHLLLLLPA